MQKLHHDSDVLEEQEFSSYSNTSLIALNNILLAVKKHQSDINIFVTDSENGKVVSKALISIDAIGRTAVCNQEGRVCISEIPFGTFHIDIISIGFVAQRIATNIQHSDGHEVHVMMISNS